MKLEKETRLKLAIVLSSIFLVGEVIGGYLANSIAIYSDAAHLLTDIAGFAIAFVASIASRTPGTKLLTFGLVRVEVFGALISVLSLWVITCFLLVSAYYRAVDWFRGEAEEVDGKLMFFVALFGVLVNICLGLVFQEDHGGVMHAHDHSHDHSHSSGEHDHHEPPADAGKVGAFAKKKCNHDDEEHGHGHGHGHEHDSATETTSLLETTIPTTNYTSTDNSKKRIINGHNHSEHDHSSHKHDSHDGHEHDSHDHDSHGHSEHSHSDDGHDHGHGDHHSSPKDVNLEAAYLHVLTDLMQSVGVAIAGFVIYLKPHWQIVDPICTVVFSIAVVYTTLALLHRIFVILLEGTPAHMDWELIRGKLSAIPGVYDVHDLHIWNLSSQSVSLTCHMKASHPSQALKEAHKICQKLGINHVTIQVQDAVDDNSYCVANYCKDDSNHINCV